jgi:hypothetical protein
MLKPGHMREATLICSAPSAGDVRLPHPAWLFRIDGGNLLDASFGAPFPRSD